MCGISGIINKNKSLVLFDEIKKMNDTIIHRGPDGEGFFMGDNFAFGHRRLSILELSELGSQPMHWKDDYIITFNGEIYNYIEIRERLISEKYTFNSNSDTEVILAAYDFWGFDCVQEFNGMWSFSLYDKKKNILFCSRDRYGVKPFYYFQNQDKFIFGSEIRQLLNFIDVPHLEEQIALDYLIAGIEEYNEKTFFQDIYKLKGGHNLIYDLTTNNFDIQPYYDLKNVSDLEKLSLEETEKLFESEFIRSINLRLRSDVKVGTCLSGGIDSSAIASFAATEYKGKDKFIAIHAKSSELKTDESEYAKKVALVSNLDLNVIEPSFEDFQKNIDKIIEIQEEPFGSPSVFMQYFVFQKARALDCIVMLDGQGGDETLLGYERYYPALIKTLNGLSKYKALVLSSKNSKLSIIQTIKFQYYFSYYKFRLKHLKKRNHFFKKEIIGKYESEIIKKLSNSYNSIFELQKTELFSTQLPHLLRYEDKNSMANSIESRLPFLDFKLVEKSININHKFKINSGWTKYILRKIISKKLPNEIVWRKNKFGFNSPETIWLGKLESSMKAEILASSILKNWIDFNSFNFENLDLRTKWRFYNFALWEKQFKVQL